MVTKTVDYDDYFCNTVVKEYFFKLMQVGVLWFYFWFLFFCFVLFGGYRGVLFLFLASQ